MSENEITIDVDVDDDNKEPVTNAAGSFNEQPESSGIQAVFMGEELARKTAAANTVPDTKYEPDESNSSEYYDNQDDYSISKDLGRVAENLASSIGRLAVKKGEQLVSRIDAEANKTTVVTEITQTTVKKKEVVKEKRTFWEKVKLGCLVYIIVVIALFFIEGCSIILLHEHNSSNQNNTESGEIIVEQQDHRSLSNQYMQELL